MEKSAWRAEARRIRKAIPQDARADKEQRIAERFIGLPELRTASTIACYAGHKSEVRTAGILRRLFVSDKTVAVPTLLPYRDVGDAEPRAWQMGFARLQHPWGLEPGAFGIPEPRQPWEEISGDAIDVVGVPGLRFGRDGSRLGNGGGHFDRFLSAHPRARRVGIAFAEQVVDALPSEAHDVGMDVLVTDGETLRFPRDK